MWYVINNVNDSDPDEISLDIQVPPESGWFSGHFPGEPILPGIAQLGMVFDAITRRTDQNFKITGIRRVRFKRVIRPDDPLRLTVKPQKNDPGAYDFRIQVRDELACSGLMTVALRSETVHVRV
jgi:3-hydroxyacyl-[acyl-carrier-protein] dehydratase